MPKLNTERANENSDLSIRQVQSFRGDARRHIMRLPEVLAIVGIGRTNIYNLMAKGQFPKSRKIGKYAIGWDSLEIKAWIDAQFDAAPIDDHLDIQDEEDPESEPVKRTRRVSSDKEEA